MAATKNGYKLADTNMPAFIEQLTHYETKCRQHLSRVRLSHVLGLSAIHWTEAYSDETSAELIRRSFDIRVRQEFESKLPSMLHEVHLVSLKANFELFLNRVLWAVWTSYFRELKSIISANEQLSMRGLADSIAATESIIDDARALIIDRLVPRYGLGSFATALENTTQIRLHQILNRKDYHYWPQIFTAFEVRHLIEHRDSQIDKKFRMDLAPYWTNSTWGARESLDRLKRIAVEEADVAQTYEAMCEATGLVAEAVLEWSSRNAGGHQAH